MAQNILFIMCDQLRYDYLGCTGHPTIRTPNIDRLAARGVLFRQAFVQSPICGPSRMSFYTGRYMTSHGSTWNMAPLRVGEWTIGDHLNPLGMRTVLCGKSHVTADLDGMARLGIDPDSQKGAKIAQGGFEVWDRLDGIHPPKSSKRPTHYNDYLKRRGYSGDNPWAEHVAMVEGHDGEAVSGWFYETLDRPARVAAEDSETAYTAARAREFIEGADDRPWCLHLSFIKPHWPYAAPAPYHAMYGANDVIPVNDGADAEAPDHPVLEAFRNLRHSQVFSRPGVREKVIAAYMGLVTQIDDEVGKLVTWLEETGRADDTVIVFTSDHGDYLGDHRLGEKELFHNASARIPLIVVDPSHAADATRGTASDALVEAIDLLPSFVEIAGGVPQPHILEGHSLLPILHGSGGDWPRDVVFSEADYSYRLARETLGQGIPDCRLQMVYDGRYKLIRAEGFRPMLYDLAEDPSETHDLAGDPEASSQIAPVIDRLTARLLRWATAYHGRITRSDPEIAEIAGQEFHTGILIGFEGPNDLAEATEKGHGGN